MASGQAPSPGDCWTESFISYCSSQHPLLHSTGVFLPVVLSSALPSLCLCRFKPSLSGCELGVRGKVHFSTTFFWSLPPLFFFWGLSVHCPFGFQFSLQILPGSQVSVSLIPFSPKLLYSNAWIPNLREIDVLLFTTPSSSWKSTLAFCMPEKSAPHGRCQGLQPVQALVWPPWNMTEPLLSTWMATLWMTEFWKTLP